MSNVLMPFIPDLIQGLDQVSRELVGFIPSVARNSSAERAAVNEVINVPVSKTNSSKNVVPGMAVPEPDKFELENVQMMITKSKNVSFGLNGEEYKGLNNGAGAGYVMGEQFKQALRTLTNEIERDIFLEASINASRAYGIPGTIPFETNLGDAAQIRKILDDNGAPSMDRSLVIDTATGANLRTLEHLTKVNEAGTAMTLRQGELMDLFNLSIKESAGVGAFKASTALSAVTIKAAKAGATSLTTKAGSGNLKAGDYITVAGDANKYLVTKAVALSGSEVIEIAKPGLRVDAAESAAITVVEGGIRSIAFNRDAIQLITRAPALPGGKDLAIDNYMLTDPRSGLSFEVRVYAGYREMRVEVACAWGVKVIKPEHMAALLG